MIEYWIRAMMVSLSTRSRVPAYGQRLMSCRVRHAIHPNRPQKLPKPNQVVEGAPVMRIGSLEGVPSGGWWLSPRYPLPTNLCGRCGGVGVRWPLRVFPFSTSLLYGHPSEGRHVSHDELCAWKRSSLPRSSDGRASRIEGRPRG